jgi:hypothetical protein
MSGFLSLVRKYRRIFHNTRTSFLHLLIRWDNEYNAMVVSCEVFVSIHAHSVGLLGYIPAQYAPLSLCIISRVLLKLLCQSILLSCTLMCICIFPRTVLLSYLSVTTSPPFPSLLRTIHTPPSYHPCVHPHVSNVHPSLYVAKLTQYRFYFHTLTKAIPNINLGKICL